MFACEWLPLDDNGRTRCIHCRLKTNWPRQLICLNQKPTGGRVVYTGIHKAQIPQKPKIPTRNHFECVHIGGKFDDGDVVAKKGCECPSETRMTSVFECDVHGECTPAGVAAEEPIMACKDCKQYRHKDSDDAEAP